MAAPFRTPSLIRIHRPKRGSCPTAATKRISRRALVGGAGSVSSSGTMGAGISFGLDCHVVESTDVADNERIWSALTTPATGIEWVLAGEKDRSPGSRAHKRMLPSHEPDLHELLITRGRKDRPDAKRSVPRTEARLVIHLAPGME